MPTVTKNKVSPVSMQTPPQPLPQLKQQPLILAHPMPPAQPMPQALFKPMPKPIMTVSTVSFSSVFILYVSRINYSKATTLKT